MSKEEIIKNIEIIRSEESNPVWQIVQESQMIWGKMMQVLNKNGNNHNDPQIVEMQKMRDALEEEWKVYFPTP